MDTFELPEYWAVKVNLSNWKTLYQWADFRFPYQHETDGKKYITSRKTWTSNLYKGLNAHDYTLITYSQFKIYVLKLQTKKQDYNFLIKLLNKLNIK